MRRYLYVVVLVMAVFVAGCSSGQNHSNSAGSKEDAGSTKPYAELRWGTNATGTQLEYRKYLNENTAMFEHLVVQGLMEFKPNGQVRPGLAKSVEHPNPTTYVYHLRPGLKFSDGKPVTVADVVYSLDLNNAKESATRAYWEDVSSVTSRGGSTVVVKLKRANVLWPEYMAEIGDVIEKAAAERVGEKAEGTSNGLPIGTGPWKFDSFTPEVEVKYSRNPYWSGPPQPAARITISDFKTEAAQTLALRSGAIDGTFPFFDPKLFSNIPGARLIKAPSAEVEFLAMNTKVAPFDDIHVRRAIAYATDVKGIVKALIPTGYAAEAETVAPTSMFADLGSSSQIEGVLNGLPKYQFDLSAAKRELAKSSVPHGFTTTVQVFAGQPVTLGAAEILAADLAKIGITVKIHEFKSGEYAAIFAGNVGMMIEGYPGLYPDPEAMFSLMLPSAQISPPGSGTNIARFKNAEVDKLLTEQRETLNMKERLNMIGRVAEIVASEVPYRPLYALSSLIALSNGYVFPTFSQWSMLFTPWAMGVRLAS